MARILIVDDEKNIRRTFEIFLSKEGHEVFLAEDVGSAIDIYKESDLDLIITDIIMPKSTGIDLLADVKSNKPDIPVIIMTWEPTVETAREAVKSDATDYLIKPVAKDALLKTVRNALDKKVLLDQKKQLEKENLEYRENLEILVQKRTAEYQKAINGTIQTIAKILEKKDPYTAGHEHRVAILSLAIAKKMNLDEEKQKQIYFAGYLHDIGKLLVPSEILSKPGKLTKGEFGVIKEHVSNGYELTNEIELPWSISEIILQHHERLDGSGYPNELQGDEIKLEARILAVSDVIEAMTAHRPYRSGLGIDIALDEIKSNAGKLYDKEISKIAVKLFEIDKFDFADVKKSIFI